MFEAFIYGRGVVSLGLMTQLTKTTWIQLKDVNSDEAHRMDEELLMPVVYRNSSLGSIIVLAGCDGCIITIQPCCVKPETSKI